MTVDSYLLETVLRVKDGEKSVAFYRDIFGMTLLGESKDESARTTTYRLAYEHDAAPSQTARDGILVLQHHWGTEKVADFAYHNGNKDPARGFGHTCVSVDHLELACTRLEEQGAKFQKKPADGRQKDIAFVLDPDGYWIELINNRQIDNDAVKVTDPKTYRFNHTMVRVKDPKVSLHFYTEVLGLKLMRTSEHEAAKFNLYFLAFENKASTKLTSKDFDPKLGVNPQSGREGILELTWNYGTETEEGFPYKNGNTEESKGFSNVTFAVEDLEATVKKIKAETDPAKFKFQKVVDETTDEAAVYITDADLYQVKLVQAK